MNITKLSSNYNRYKEPLLFGRYITNLDIEKWFSGKLKSNTSILGYSVEKRPIYGIKLGRGHTRVLLWSQMHGNESTTTKALFDLLNFLESNEFESQNLLKNCTLFIIPILNPDGAHAYTRLNANGCDLNRDAQNVTQPESKVLKQAYTDFNPDYCFNLHGQRTIFGAGSTGKVATLSFLSPAQDADRSLTPNRITAMAIIGTIASALKPLLPQSIGRYDDAFNLNCVGDTFQNLGTPTLLYEAGHYPNDYNREEVRRFVFLALAEALLCITNNVKVLDYKTYFGIPENTKNHRDIIIRNARISETDLKLKSIVFQYREELTDQEILFRPILEGVFDSTELIGHHEIDAKGKLVRTFDLDEIFEGYENDFVLINNKKTALKP